VMAEAAELKYTPSSASTDEKNTASHARRGGENQSRASALNGTCPYPGVDRMIYGLLKFADTLGRAESTPISGHVGDLRVPPNSKVSFVTTVRRLIIGMRRNITT
jgi:hypothetical protein